MMQISRPLWWKAWYKYQAATLAGLVLNLAIALAFPSAFLTPLNWMSAGLLCGVFLSSSTVNAVLDHNRRLQHELHHLHIALRTLMETKVGEVAREIDANRRRRADDDTDGVDDTRH